jgi:hypothetical protein
MPCRNKEKRIDPVELNGEAIGGGVGGGGRVRRFPFAAPIQSRARTEY